MAVMSTASAKILQHRPREQRNITPTIGWPDQLFLALGAKQMSGEKATTPLEWNGKVVGLTVGLLTVIAMLVGTVFWAATLAANVENLKAAQLRLESESDKRVLERNNQVRGLEERIRVLEVQVMAAKK